MLATAHWSHALQTAGDVGFDPLLERLREAVQMIRLSSGAGSGRGDMAELISFLEEIFGERLVVHPPFSEPRSFDENWLCALLRAQRDVDIPSYRFLLSRRMSAEQASEAHFLICRAQIALVAG